LQGPLHKVIAAALDAASLAGYREVTIPAIRTGVMLGTVEKTAGQAVGELFRGIDDHFTRNPDSNILKFTFVIYGQNAVMQEIAGKMPTLFLN
jgi:O-acetyl-ADP-ribose deacetylase (regulator of RNase III)